MTLIKLLANLGYGSRQDVRNFVLDGRVTSARTGLELPLTASIDHSDIRFDGEALDPVQGTVLMLNKPDGYTCSTEDPGRIIYQLLPDRFMRRKPIMSSVGRLDRDCTGLLIMTDDGNLLHKIKAPRSKVTKTYDVSLARPLSGDEEALFASGTLMLRSETIPLAPARLTIIGEREARIIIAEGRYHQVKRMFAATGNHVQKLHRSAIGALTLGDLAEGKWRALAAEEIALIFEAPFPARYLNP